MTLSRPHPLTLRIPPVAVGLVLAPLGWLASYFTPQLRFDFAAKPAAALGLAFAGVAASVLGVVSFRRARTTVNPLRPQSATALVVGGIYRVTRNPMYLGFLLLLVAWAVWLGHPLALLTLPGFVIYMNEYQIRPEEAALQALFGSEFNAYRARVRRWL